MKTPGFKALNEIDKMFKPATGEFLDNWADMIAINRKAYLFHIWDYIIEFEEKDKYLRFRLVYYIKHQKQMPESKIINFLTFFWVFKLSGKVWKEKK